MTDIQIISLILLYQGLRGSLKGQADTIQTDPDYRDNGWKAKWKVDQYGNRQVMDLSWKNQLHRWYVKKFKVRYEEAFPLSSTLLVAFTDRWHLLNFFQARAVEILICILADNYWLILVQWIPAAIGFWLNFRKKIVSK